MKVYHFIRVPARYLFIPVILFACFIKEAESYPIAVDDALGNHVVVESASRVIAVGGDVAEIIYALGVQERLIARDDTCGYPQAVTKLPSVGYMRTLTPEGVLSLNPTVVLVTQGAGPPAAVKVLRDAGTPLIQVSQEFSPEAVIQKFRLIARALNRKASGEAWIRRIQRWNDRLQQSLHPLQNRPKVLCLMSVQRGTLLAAGNQTSAEAMIRLAGGVNALSGFTGYKPVSVETALAAQPDALLIPSHSAEKMNKLGVISSLPELHELPAVKKGKIIVMDSQYLLMFGPRYVQAAAELAAAIHAGYSIPEELHSSDE